jgi:glycosyltransferase involved in cell wall biosynthesis
MKKILFISEYFYPRKSGGEIWAFDFCKELIKQGNKVTVITGKYDDLLSCDEIINKIQILRPLKTASLTNFLGRLYFSIKLKYYINKFISNNKIDEIHTMAFGVNVVVSKIAFKNKIDCTTWVHAYFGKYWFLFENLFIASTMYLMEKINLILDKSSKICVPSSSTKELISKKNVFVVPNKIDKKEILSIVKKNKSDLYEKYQIPKNKKIILTIGSLTKLKRIHEIISKIIIPDDFFYVIVGDGKYRNKILDIIKNRNISKKTILITKTSREDTLKLISLSEYVVNYSLIESFGLVLAEALALNKKIISTEVGLLKDNFQNNIKKKYILLIKNLEDINYQII